MSREKVGLALLASAFVGIGAYACSSSDTPVPQPFIDDVPSGTTTAPPAPEDMDANQFPSDAPSYAMDAAYAHTLCESTCSCDIGAGQYCTGQFTNLSFTTCDVPDGSTAGSTGTTGLRLGCDVVPSQCLAGGKPYCPCIIQSLGAYPCLPVCEDMTNGQVELYCPNP